MTLLQVSVFQPGDQTKVTEWVIISSFEHQITFNGVPIRAVSMELTTPAGTRTMLVAAGDTVPASKPSTIRSWCRFWRLSQK